MATGNDLMCLGLPPFLAQVIAEAGTGPATLTVAGSAFATATRIKVGQSMVSAAGGGAATNTSGLALPAVGGSTGVLIGDLQVIACTGTDTLVVYASSGVTINGSGGNTSNIFVPVGTTMILFPTSTSTWVAIKGA